MEPHAAIADWDADGHLTVWDSTQGPSADRNTLARVLDLPPEHLVGPQTGQVLPGRLVGIKAFVDLFGRPLSRGRADPAPRDAGLPRSLGRLGSLGALRPVSHTWTVVRGARAA